MGPLLPGGMSFTVNRVPFGGGGVPSMRAPMSSIFPPTEMSAGVRSVHQMRVETPPDFEARLLVGGPSISTFAVPFASCPVTTRRIGEYPSVSFTIDWTSGSCKYAYFASSTRVRVAGPSPTMISQASSSLAPSQCTCLAKCVTNEPVGMATVRLGSNLLPVATHQVPLITVMKRSLGWKCGRLKLPGLNRFMTTYSPGFSGSPTSTAWLMPAAPVGSRHLSWSGALYASAAG